VKTLFIVFITSAIWYFFLAPFIEFTHRIPEVEISMLTQPKGWGYVKPYERIIVRTDANTVAFTVLR